MRFVPTGRRAAAAPSPSRLQHDSHISVTFIVCLLFCGVCMLEVLFVGVKVYFVHICCSRCFLFVCLEAVWVETRWSFKTPAVDRNSGRCWFTVWPPSRAVCRYILEEHDADQQLLQLRRAPSRKLRVRSPLLHCVHPGEGELRWGEALFTVRSLLHLPEPQRAARPEGLCNCVPR